MFRRISDFVCANMTDTEKLKLIVIGRARGPRCFRRKNSLPVIYKNNKKSWMKTDIFSEFIKKLNKQMLTQNRKVALIDIKPNPSTKDICLYDAIIILK